MTTERIVELLSIPIWSSKEIMEYFDVGRHKADTMRNQAIIKANGSVECFATRVLADSVLMLYAKTNREKELGKIRNYK